MDASALRALGFAKVTDLLAGYAVTDLGKRKAAALLPLRDEADARYALDATTEMARALAGNYTLPLAPVDDVATPAAKARAGGGPLEAQTLWRIATCMDMAGRVAASLMRMGADFPVLTSMGTTMPQCPELVRAIRQAIDGAGMVLDGASQELKTIRKRVHTLRRRIEEMLRRLVARPDVRPHLQYANPTIFRDRYVLPVNAYRKHEIPGLVHGSSDSGATLYIEPMGIIEPGNELTATVAEEEEEVRRILWELTRAVAAEADQVTAAADRLAEVDVVRAKGVMSNAFGMCRPELSGSGALELRGARHPLLLHLTRPDDVSVPSRIHLDFDAVVPLDVHLGQDFNVLVITGPNTGGKTVVLKTVGLLSLMARAGMHVPAEHALVPCYDAVFADIGDEQSIEQSLSTFSSHMSRIIHILREATPQSLVLLDELGAGTDPAEGSALGEAVLKQLVEVGCAALVVTHLGRLKTFAVSRPGAENSSVEFDAETLQPTYRLTIGTVGSSNALQIAKRLGLPEPILEEARGLLDKEAGGEYSSLLDEIQLTRADAEERRDRMQYLEQEAAKLKAEYEETLVRLRAEEARKEAETGLQMRDDLQRLHEEAERLHEDLRHSHKPVAKRVRAVREGLKKCLDDLSQVLEGHRLQRPLRPGDEVYVIKLHKWGTVAHVGRRGERARVNVGNTEIQVDVKDLQPWGEAVQ